MTTRKSLKHLLCLIAFVCFSATAFAQVPQDCGAMDCPGRCGRFIDQNGDGFCDRGRLSNPVKTTEPEAVTTPAKSEVKTEVKPESEVKKQTETKAEIGAKKEVAAQSAVQTEAVPDKVEAAEEATAEKAPAEAETKPVKAKSPYSLILISAITLGLYLLTFILVKANVMKKATHRKIWNVALLITGLVSCLLGFFLVIQINYNLKMEWLWTVKLYHVQFGIAMTLIMIIHILWHMNYWKSIVTLKKKSEEPR